MRTPQPAIQNLSPVFCAAILGRQGRRLRTAWNTQRFLAARRKLSDQTGSLDTSVAPS